jgi:transposase
MDETSFLRARRDRPTLFVSGLVDTATGRLLDVVADRTAKAIVSWLACRDRAWLDRIGVVTLDAHRGYANAVGVHLGHATLVVDHFHVIRLANAVIDDALPPRPTATDRASRPQDRSALADPQATAQSLRRPRQPRLVPAH